MVTLAGLLIAFGAALIVALTLPSYMHLLTDGGLHRPNYRGMPIPVSAGLLPALTAALTAAVYGAFGQELGFVTAVTVVVAAVVGLLDDSAGNRDSAGLKGHLLALVRGRLSTGALKALIIPVAALCAAASLSRPAVWIFVDTALISLAANAVNLLDVRPGRAVKGILLLMTVAWLGGLAPLQANLLAVFAFTLLAYAPWDLRAKAMLGDSGANAFGIAAGWFCTLSLAPLSRLVLTALLVLLHVLSERVSLSQLIERNPLLRSVDRWGRP